MSRNILSLNKICSVSLETASFQTEETEKLKIKSDRFNSNPAFERQGKEWLTENPLPIPTERETSTLSRGEPVYRALFVRC